MYEEIYIDAHAHLLTEKSFIDLSVSSVFCNAVKPLEFKQLKGLSKKHACIKPFYGIHPWFVEQITMSWADELLDYLSDENAGIGEIGLDRSDGKPEIELQTDIFRLQLELAVKLSRSVTIHCVDAWAMVLDALRDIKQVKPFIVHSYSGSVETAQELINLGGYLSFSERNLLNQKNKNTFKKIPIEHIMLESDFSGNSVYASDIKKVYRLASEILSIDQNDLVSLLVKNEQTFKN